MRFVCDNNGSLQVIFNGNFLLVLFYLENSPFLLSVCFNNWKVLKNKTENFKIKI